MNLNLIIGKVYSLGTLIAIEKDTCLFAKAIDVDCSKVYRDVLETLYAFNQKHELHYHTPTERELKLIHNLIKSKCPLNPANVIPNYKGSWSYGQGYYGFVLSKEGVIMTKGKGSKGIGLIPITKIPLSELVVHSGYKNKPIMLVDTITEIFLDTVSTMSLGDWAELRPKLNDLVVTKRRQYKLQLANELLRELNKAGIPLDNFMTQLRVL